MSKKKNLEQEVLISETEETTDAVVVTDESEVKPAKEEKVSKNSKQENKSKDDKSKNKKDKKPKEKGKFKRKARETMSELKKVTWPSFGEVCKKTGIVLSVVVVFGLVLFGLDALLGFLFGLLTKVGK